MPVFGDTLTNIDTGEILHGYVTTQRDNGKTIIYTVQNGLQSVDLSHWRTRHNRLGRADKVVIIEFDGSLSLKLITDALVKSITESIDSGAIFTILEIDSPGGKVEHIEKICDTLIRQDQSEIIAYVKGGRYGGATSGASAIALACNRIYMGQNSIIGAATITGIHDPNEKLSVAWQQYLGSLAECRNRPGVLARAMVDKDMEVVEVIENGKHKFIEPMQADPNHMIVRTWTKIGSLLTLTADEAVQSGLAQAVTESREEILFKNDAAHAEVVVDSSVNESQRTFRKARLKFSRLRVSLDANIKRVEKTDNLEAAINLLRGIRTDYKSLLLLARRFPDLYLDKKLIEEQLGSAEEYYQRAKTKKLRLNGSGNQSDH